MNNEETRLLNEDQFKAPQTPNNNLAPKLKPEEKPIYKNPIATGVAGVVIGAAAAGFTVGAANSSKPVSHKNDSDDTDKEDKKVADNKADEKADEKVDEKVDEKSADEKVENGSEEKTTEEKGHEEKVADGHQADEKVVMGEAHTQETAQTTEGTPEANESATHNVAAQTTSEQPVVAETIAETAVEEVPVEETAATQQNNVVLGNLGEVKFAVVDADNFEDAFNQAREMVGPGGAFEFQGNIYATYTPEEWNALPSNEQLAFQKNVMDNYYASLDDQVETDMPDAEVGSADHHVDYNFGQLNVAHVEANSFSEAFAQARAQVGPGGIFEYKGQIYGTYYENEWDQMSPAEKHAFQASASQTMAHETPSYAQTNAHSSTPHYTVEPNVEPQLDHNVEETIEVETVDNDIQVLGVETVMTEEGPMHFAGIAAGDDQMLLVDVDNDGVFDFMVHDDNYDGQIDLDEIQDIADYDIHIHDLDPNAANYMASDNDLADYDDFNDDIMPA